MTSTKVVAFSIVGLLLLVPVQSGKVPPKLPSNTKNCAKLMSPALVTEIKGYQSKADQIMKLIVNGEFKGTTYEELQNLVETHPVRPSGSKFLEDSIDYIKERMNHYGLKNVRGERVQVPHWVRGEEKAELLEPSQKNIQLLGLGTSVGTPEEGLTGQIIVVKSFADLDKRKDEVAGKIVVYNQGWLGSYDGTKVYKENGASHAAQYGAIAALIQNIAPQSLGMPHTGSQSYWSNVTQIPVACITMEDADYLFRLQQKGAKMSMNLKMFHDNLPWTTSRNVIGEIGGASKPKEYVAVTGHIDSWDVGQGAMDNAGGVMISVMALAALKHLGLAPKRKLQAIVWTAEESGLHGATGFVKEHEKILRNYSVVFESDSGTFKPIGLDFAGSEKAGCIVQEVLKLTAKINTTTYAQYPTVSSDISRLIAKGVPGLSLKTVDDLKYWYRHTELDTIDMIDSQELDLNTALWAVASYVLSDISEKLPRNPPAH